MIKNLQIAQLLDTYGQLLTPRQRRIIEDYYSFDLSLGEIAEGCKITRQAVFNSIKTTENALQKYEQTLGLCKIKSELRRALATSEDERLQVIQSLLQN